MNMGPTYKSMFNDGTNVSTLNDVEFLEKVKLTNKQNIWMGVLCGWWENCDEKGPIKVFWVNKSDFGPKEIMAHVILKVLVKPFQCPFESISDARRNGWNKPITVGNYCW